ncbi:MAG: hypothetical protein NTX63_00565 [Candidatus Peregrinibacteria bacterium]|nr:hypothetical protein [Candidatus Peregrinibacteria bacterium]
MALDTVGPNFSYLDGVITPLKQHAMLDAFIIEKIIKDGQEDVRQRIGIPRPDWGEPLPPPPSRPMNAERDEDDSDRGYFELDM